MKINLSTDIIKFIGPPLNELEAFKIKKLTKNHFSNYQTLKKELNKAGLIFVQEFDDLFIIKTKKQLSDNEVINFIKENLLNEDQITNFSEEINNIKKDILQLNESFYHINILIPYILKEMFLNHLNKFLNNDLIIYYRDNKIIFKSSKYSFDGFIFQFKIGTGFKIFLKVDAVFESNSGAVQNPSKLPRSRQRKKVNKEILKLLKNIKFFCGGKEYKINSDFLNFEKKLKIREC